MAKTKLTERDRKNMIVTDLNKKLYDYNNENSGYSEQDISSFITGNSQPNFNTGSSSTPDYMGGVNPVGQLYDYESTRYDGDIYANDLENLDNIRSQNQGVLASLGNSTANFLSKTAVNVVGGLTGAVYGAASAIGSGDWSQLWDNDVTTALDNASDSIGEYFKVYKSSDYQDKFILNKLFSNPLMFTDEFMDTLSFTAGAVVTELLSGGMASASILPRASKYLNALSKTSKSLDVAEDVASIAGNIGRAANISNVASGLERAGKLTRQLATGAFWEASVEARQLGKEMRDNMVNDYINDMAQQGFQVTEDNIPQNILDDIDNRVKNASAVTMALNTALVGFSNLSQFPTIFKTYGNAKKGIGQSITSELVDGAERYTTRLATMSPTQRSLRKTWAAVKNPFMEGFIEEGGQGVISGTMGSFFDRKNDIEGVDEAQRFLSSFAESFIDTYATKEGLNEVLMGALIGGVGSPGAGALSVLGRNNAVGKYGFQRTVDANGNESFIRQPIWDGGIVGGLREFNQEQAEVQEYVNTLNSQPELIKALQTNYDAQVRNYSLNKDLDDAIENNDHFEFQNSKDNILFNYVNSRLELGMREDLDFKVNELKNMSPEDFYVTFKGEDDANKASKQEMQDFQNESIDNINKNIDAVSKARNTVQAFSQDLNITEDLVPVLEDMTYYLAKAETTSNREDSIYNRLSKLSNGRITRANVTGTTVAEAIKNLEKNSKDSDASEWTKKELKKLKSFANKYDNSLPSSFASSILNYQETDPADYKSNEVEIDNMLKDLPKIQAYKENLISLYDSLTNTRNMNRYANYLSDLDAERLREAEQTQSDLDNQASTDEINSAVEATNARANQATTNQPQTPELNDLMSDADLAFEVAQQYQQNNIDSGLEIDTLEEPEIVDPLESVTTDPVSNQSPFDNYESEVPNLLEVLIPQAFLRNFKGQVDYVKKVYTAYRNSRSNLADIGTERDIKDFNWYRDNVYSKATSSTPTGDIIENDKVDNVDANTETEAKITTIDEVATPEETIETPETNDDVTSEPVSTEDSNTNKIIEDEIIVQKQVDNPDNMKEIPVDLSYTAPELLESEEYLDTYLGVSLTNIHAKKIGGSTGFNYSRLDNGKYEILDTYPKSALLPNIGLPGSTIQVRLASKEEYMNYTNKLDYDTIIENSETLPLLGLQEDKFIGFILTPKGALSSSRNRISNEDLTKLKSFRNYVFNNQGNVYDLTVADKTMGIVTYRKDTNGKSIYRPISKHLSKDGKRLADDVHIVVDVNGVLHSHKGYEFDGNVINSRFGSGHIYTLVPLADGNHVKIPVQMSKINESDADTVLDILKYFTAHSSNPNDTGYIQLRNKLQNDTGINLSNINEFYMNLGNIIYIQNQGINQFFTRSRNEDGSYSFTIKSPSGQSFIFNQSDLHNPNMNSAFKDFITQNFYRGVRVQMMNTGSYQHLNSVNGTITAKQYPNYIDYVMESNILLTDVYGENIDSSSNRMSFVLSPFIKVNYPSTGNYNFSESNTDVQSLDQIPDTIPTTATNDSFLDDIVDDEYDINFSMLDIKNDADQIISPDIEAEINNFIKFCK